MAQTTIDQRIADAEAKLQRLRAKSRQLENGQKIILGGLLLNAARHQPDIRGWLLKEAGKEVTRDVDKQRLAPLLSELASMPANSSTRTNS